MMKTAAKLERLAFAHYSSSEKHAELKKQHRKQTTYLRDKLRGL